MAGHVSAREADNAERLLRDLARHGANRYCADCGDRAPNHVILSLGTFVCSVCAGVHRDAKRTGVRSLDTATFAMDDVYRMEDRGNDLARKRWMARWSPRDFPEPKPGDIVAIREFIWLKYDGSWASKSMIPAGSARASRTPRHDRESDPDRRGRDRDYRDRDRGNGRGRDSASVRESGSRRDFDWGDRDRNDRLHRDVDRHERDRRSRYFDDDANSEDERRPRKNKKSKKSNKVKYDYNESATEDEDSAELDEVHSNRRKVKKKGSKAKKSKGGKPPFAGSIEDLIQQNTASIASSATAQSFGSIVQTPMGPAIVTPQGLMPPAMAAQLMGMPNGIGMMSGMGAVMPAPWGVGNMGAGSYPVVNSGIGSAPEPAPLALPAPPSANVSEDPNGLSTAIQVLNISDNSPARPTPGVSSMSLSGLNAMSVGVPVMNSTSQPGATGASGATLRNGIMATMGPGSGTSGGGTGGAPSPGVAAAVDASNRSNPFSSGAGGSAMSTNPFDDF